MVARRDEFMDEGDRLRERQILWLVREVRVWRALGVLAILDRLTGGSLSNGALNALQVVWGLL